MSKVKSHSVDKDCLCAKCPLRFHCFTEERVFSDPIYQGLFEALIAQGKTREEALEDVTRELKWKINSPNIQPAQPSINVPYVNPYFPTVDSNAWELSSSVSIGAKDGEYKITYTMHDGREINLNAENLRVYLQEFGNPIHSNGS